MSAAKDQLARYLERLESVPAIADDQQLRGFLLMARSGSGMLRDEAAAAWVQLIDHAAIHWAETKREIGQAGGFQFSPEEREALDEVPAVLPHQEGQ